MCAIYLISLKSVFARSPYGNDRAESGLIGIGKSYWSLRTLFQTQGQPDMDEAGQFARSWPVRLEFSKLNAGAWKREGYLPGNKMVTFQK